MIYPQVATGHTERLPSDGVQRCGSALAHGECLFAGLREHHLLRCEASAMLWRHCRYRAAGFVNVYRDADGEASATASDQQA